MNTVLGLRGRLYVAAGMRSGIIGLTGVLLGLYLAHLGATPKVLGVTVAAGLAGTACGTLLVTVFAHRIRPRLALLGTTAVSAGGLLLVATAVHPTLLAVAAFLGMVSGAGRDRSPAQVLEQSMLADRVDGADRTNTFARYALVQEVCGALGALAAGGAALAAELWTIPSITADRWTLAAGGLVLLILLPLYAGLPEDRLTRPGSTPDLRHRPARASRTRVHRLAWLFALDSLGGGFLLSAILTYWFFQRFGLGGTVLGPLFFAARGLNALSYPCAAWLSRRIGLVRTMVFTHLPSNALLFLLPWLPARDLVIALFLVRESLVQMDVPARQSYIAAVTEPGTRTYALGITGLVRNLGWTVGPALAGSAMTAFGLGAPLMIGASLKGVYDGILYAMFRHVPAPEEVRASKPE